jgi:hypothetical protein
MTATTTRTAFRVAPIPPMRFSPTRPLSQW